MAPTQGLEAMPPGMAGRHAGVVDPELIAYPARNQLRHVSPAYAEPVRRDLGEDGAGLLLFDKGQEPGLDHLGCNGIVRSDDAFLRLPASGTSYTHQMP